MNQQHHGQISLFSSGLELANLVVNSNLLDYSWKAISDLNTENNLFDNQTQTRVVKYKVYKPDNVTIIAFVSSPEKSSVNHLQNEGSFELFDIVRPNLDQSLSINEAAGTIFSSILKDQNIGSVSPLIITGNSLGGFIASLFTVHLLDKVVQKDTKPPLCITFGSHFLGDNAFQRTISERPTWNSCFLHVVSDQDSVRIGLISSETGSHTPFGTFLLCSDTGFACLEEPESILEVLNTMSSEKNHEFPNKFSGIFDYGSLLEGLKNNAIRKTTSTSRRTGFSINSRTQRKNVVVNPLEAEISLILEAIGVKRPEVITSIAKRVENLLMRRRNKFDPTKKLNDMKIHLTYLEWYKKCTVEQGGYYDAYKGTMNSRTGDESKSKAEIVKHKRILNQYWEKTVKEVNEMPQKEGVPFRIRWLYAGTNYRRIIEPLDIAEYYDTKGNRDYMKKGRSEHYKLLEKWINEDTSVTQGNTRNKACSLTEDSCFWARVEEGIVSCKVLKDQDGNTESKESSKDDLSKFEKYLMDQIVKNALSPEIFKHGSSFIQWWNEYIEIMGGASYDSDLSNFMKNYRDYA